MSPQQEQGQGRLATHATGVSPCHSSSPQGAPPCPPCLQGDNCVISFSRGCPHYMVPHLVTGTTAVPRSCSAVPRGQVVFQPWPRVWVIPLFWHYTSLWLPLPNITAAVCASQEEAAGRRRCGAPSTLSSLCCRQLSPFCPCCAWKRSQLGHTHLAQGTAACRFPLSICTASSSPRASKMSFWRCAETKHTPGASAW